ncbi:hypothetical protein [Halobacteriovorax sp. HLS]|uniref:hypothetical protein n=1 Tax=Halobacteriovorax sp. HLS TaxID=2234000 RepID=UPI000FDC7CAF|nr:hypothetical protein [Halobacteriovorax sp. HLS]
MIKFILVLLFSINVAWAIPKEVHFFFISPESSALIIKKLSTDISFSKQLLSQTALETECVPMGDGCFNPQVGFIEGDSGAGKESAQPNPMKMINAEDVNLINCDKDNYFDIYCGKAMKEGKPSGVEFWIDTSSSMRSIDFNADPAYCERRSLASKIRTSCGTKVDIHIFDTSKKQAGSLDSVCQNYGLNNQKKLMQWIQDSRAKSVYILTDKDEFSIELRDFLHSISAKIYGGDSGTYTMKSMHGFVDNAIGQYCK